MATNLEMQTWQRDKLYTLLKLKALNKGYEIIGLNDMIEHVETIMQEEDVAWVEKKISQRHGQTSN